MRILLIAISCYSPMDKLRQTKITLKWIGLFFLSIFLFTSCELSKEKKQVALYQQHCATCHVLPSVDVLTKELWANSVLPDMGARMGMKDSLYNPYAGLSYEETEIIVNAGIYPLKPQMTREEWVLLKEYIIALAPGSFPDVLQKEVSAALRQFEPKPISLDGEPGALITYLGFKGGDLWYGDLNGNLWTYNFLNNKPTLSGNYGTAIVDFSIVEDMKYITTIGKLDPSEFSSGKIFTVKENLTNSLPDYLHRPVNALTMDLNQNGKTELVVSEFGNLIGKISLFTLNDQSEYTKSILLNQPGTIRVVPRDMNSDGRIDLIALTSQGDESITILYQQSDLKFIPEKVLRFSPIYGTSWFELLDYDGDGDIDIVTANGDNADKTYIAKPYHGLRIHINNGKNQFEEKYFYRLNGATRFVARDFDQDGDVDFAVISTFPDYEKYPEYSFVYLENRNSAKFEFQPELFKESANGRWFLMDAADIDGDGDEDVVLSSFTYVFTPVPDQITKLWQEKDVDIMILENKLK